METPTSRPEHELVLLCSSAESNNDLPQRINRLAEQITDWPYVHRFAKRHAVLPMLHHRLVKNAAGILPSPIAQELQNEFHANAARNLLLTNVLSHIVESFNAEQIPLLAYKGPTLAVLVYGETSLRRFVDLDIIVQRDNVRRAMTALNQLGFSSGLSDAQIELLLATQSAIPMVSDSGRLTVELHWEFVSKGFANIRVSEGVWSRAISVAVDGVRIKTLSPEDLLSALCVHGTKHAWERLSWICDVAQLLGSRSVLNWSLVMQLAEEARVKRMLLIGLRLAADLLGAQIPIEVDQSIRRNASVSRLASDVTSRLFNDGNSASMSLATTVRFHLRARQGLMSKARYCRFILMPTEADVAAVSVPSNRSIGYYFWRPLRLARKSLRET